LNNKKFSAYDFIVPNKSNKMNIVLIIFFTMFVSN
jgi:hypothetical protein